MKLSFRNNSDLTQVRRKLQPIIEGNKRKQEQVGSVAHSPTLRPISPLSVERSRKFTNIYVQLRRFRLIRTHTLPLKARITNDVASKYWTMLSTCTNTMCLTISAWRSTRDTARDVGTWYVLLFLKSCGSEYESIPFRVLLSRIKT